MNISEIRKLVEIINENDLVEFEIEEGDFSLKIRRSRSADAVQPQPVMVQAHHPQPSVPAAAPQSGPSGDSAGAEAAEPGLEVIKSPMVGTFYRAPSPDSQPFVDKGHKVAADSVVCIVEAMKVMNEIQAEKSGTIEQILVDDGEPVEFGQPLFKIKV